MDRPSEPTALTVLDLVRARPATLGSGRLICVDGPSGSGKTTLAGAVAALATDTHVVAMDELYDGWGGLPTVGGQLAALLRPLAAGSAGSYLRYDWHARAYAETVTVAPIPLLVVEGVGSWAPEFVDLVTLLVWVEAPADERLGRALARDGADLEPELRTWAVAEQEHFARTGVRSRADLVVSG